MQNKIFTVNENGFNSQRCRFDLRACFDCSSGSATKRKSTANAMLFNALIFFDMFSQQSHTYWNGKRILNLCSICFLANNDESGWIFSRKSSPKESIPHAICDRNKLLQAGKLAYFSVSYTNFRPNNPQLRSGTHTRLHLIEHIMFVQRLNPKSSFHFFLAICVRIWQLARYVIGCLFFG